MITFDDTRHTWLCLDPRDECPASCVCRCHRPAPSGPDYMNGWVAASDV